MRKSKRTLDQKVAFVADLNFAIHVTDLEKAESFYSGVLGFKLLKRTSERLVYDAGKITPLRKHDRHCRKIIFVDSETSTVDVFWRAPRCA